MQITLGHGMGMGPVALGSSTPTGPAPTPTPITAFSAQGWSATYPAPPTFDPVGAPETLDVTRQGFDATGASTTLNDTLTVMARVREPYPNQSTLSADQVALSDFVYDGDVVSGVLNNSARSYPKPIAAWLNHDREHVTTSTHVLRLAVAHAHARNGRPVAAVKFIAFDGANTVEQTVSSMSTITYDATGLSVPHFAATMDLSTLDQGALLVIDAVIYPWVGDAFTISVDADSYPSPNLTTLRMFNDRTGAYGTAYAYVDATSGNNATAVTSATPGTAQAAPYATVAGATAGIRDYNAATFARANDVGGGIIRLEVGTHNHSNFKSAGTSVNIPLVIEAADPANRATTIYTDGGASVSNGTPMRLKIKDITVRKTGGSVILFDNYASNASRFLIAENVIWDGGTASAYSGWIWRIGKLTLINCARAGNNPGHLNPLGTAAKMGVCIGSQGGSGAGTYTSIGCTMGSHTARVGSGNNVGEAGTLIGWNVISNGSTNNPIVRAAKTIGPRGFALVGNIVESWGTHTNAGISLNADANNSPAQNVVIQSNTLVGERLNFLYLDGSVNAEKSGYVRGNVFQTLNIKGDVFAQQSANTGNWAMRYKTGWTHNAALSGSNNGTGYTPTSWMGEIASLGEVVSVDPDWANDRSNTGTDTGGGVYAPGAGTALPTLPAALAAYPVDLFGRSIVPGSAHIGAVQQP